MRLYSFIAIVVLAAPVSAQSAADGPVLGAARFGATGSLKMFSTGGSVRLVGWDHDSVLARGRIPRDAHFSFNRGNMQSMKLGIIDYDGDSTHPADFVVYLPRRATVSLKTVTADVDAANVGGVFNSASGSVRVTGAVAKVEIETISGSIDLNVSTPWVRARTGDGHLLLRGTPQDADVSTVGGTLDIASPSLMRGQFATVTGDIHYVGSPLAGAIFDFSSHSGAVDLQLAPDASGVLALSSVTGMIENGLTNVRPAAGAPHSMRLVLGRGASGAQVAVRTFKGTIRLRPQ